MTDSPYQIDDAAFNKPEGKNTLVDYMYRDASNYKQHLFVVLEGRMTKDQATALCGMLDEGEYFLPGMVGLPAAPWSEGADGSHYDDDHPWHELTGLAPTENRSGGITVDQFLADVAAAHAQGWKEED